MFYYVLLSLSFMWYSNSMYMKNVIWVQQIILTDCHWSIGIHWSHHGHILTAPSWELLEVARPEVLHESLPGDIKNHIFFGHTFYDYQEWQWRKYNRGNHLESRICLYNCVFTCFIMHDINECKLCILPHCQARTAPCCAYHPSVSQPNEAPQARATYFTPRRSMAKFT